MVMTHSGKELGFLAHLFCDVGIPVLTPISLLVDNQSTITLVENPIFHMHSKHIEVHHHWLQEKVGEEMINLEYVLTTEQIADIFTKLLNLEKFWKFQDMLGLVQIILH